ncbi:MAG: hypothetical protein EOP04_33120 [Proteobacteria bacterium]|nr:MAG: hypothetical protein EOP04_33120 [Pseudomonadota bacterium]
MNLKFFTILILFSLTAEAKDVKNEKCLREGKFKLDAFIAEVNDKSNYCNNADDCLFHNTSLRHRLTINKKEAGYAIPCVDLAHEKYRKACTGSSSVNVSAEFSFPPLNYDCIAKKCVEQKTSRTRRNWKKEYDELPAKLKASSPECAKQINSLTF